MESAIPPLPSERVVPQPRARDGTNKRDREKSGRGFTLPHEPHPEAGADPTPTTDAPAPAAETPHPLSEEGVGGRLDVTA